MLNASQKAAKKNDQWFTPPWVLDLAREWFGDEIDYDLASSEKANALVRAHTYFSLENPFAPEKIVDPKNVFCNPPFSDVAPFCHAIMAQSCPWFLVKYLKAETHVDRALRRAATHWFVPAGRIRYVDGATMTVKATGWGASVIYFGGQGNPAALKSVPEGDFLKAAVNP